MTSLFVLAALQALWTAPPPADPSRTALASGTFAITDVTVIPMTSEAAIRSATVLVRNGRIAAIGRDVRVSDDAVRVDGRGKFLIPGLADMHTHLYSDGALVPDAAAPAELGVMLANGVTAARIMIGTPEHLGLRRQLESGDVAGPQLWVASPHLTTREFENARVVATPADVRAAVREFAAAGYDFIKITFGITGALYDAVVEEARAAGVTVVGHVEPEVGVLRALAARQPMEHLDAFFEGALADSAPSRASLTQYGVYQPANWASLDHVDEAKLDALARATAESRVWVIPTLMMFNQAFGAPLTDAELAALPDWRLIPVPQREATMRSRARYWSQPVPRERRAEYARIRSGIVKRIADTGGRILAGSDAPDLLMAYGFALHRELAAFVAAGLTPYHALLTATRNPAEYLGALSEWGTLEVGKRADLVLLDADPLVDIGNTTRIAGVAVGGRWFDRETLDALIAAGERAIAGQ